jgi:hypothetical protein
VPSASAETPARVESPGSAFAGLGGGPAEEADIPSVIPADAEAESLPAPGPLLNLIPARARRKVDSLGPPLFAWRIAPARITRYMTLSAAVVGFGVFFFILFFVLSSAGVIPTPGPKEKAGFRGVILVVVILGMLPVVIGGVALGSFYADSTWRIVVFHAGFVSIKRGKVDIWPYDDIKTVRAHKIDTSQTSYGGANVARGYEHWWLWAKDGRHLPLIAQLEPIHKKLCLAIMDATFARMLPAAKAKVAAGETVVFLPLGISRAGVAFQGRQIPWNRIGGFMVRGGYLMIHGGDQGGMFAKAPLDEIENCHVFLALLELGLAARGGP